LHDQSRLFCLESQDDGSGVREALTRLAQLLNIATRRFAQQKRIGPGEHQVVTVAVKPGTGTELLFYRKVFHGMAAIEM